ncbi:MAG: hypothetical protein ABI761_16560 [Saprospiraceae bacterium]
MKFNDTKNIQVGDTMFLFSDSLLPVLLVKYISSTSCVGNKMNNSTINVSDSIWIRNKEKAITKLLQAPSLGQDTFNIASRNGIPQPKKEEKKKPTYKITGRFAVNSYSSFNNFQKKPINRFRYTFMLNSKNLKVKGWSGESYLSYRSQPGLLSTDGFKLFDNLKVYNLALKYDFSEKSHIYIGRKINPNASNVGAIDGLQYERKFKNVLIGTMVGSRPDYTNYGFNPSLWQAGVFVNHSYQNKKGDITNTIALFEQRNKTKTDRRFMYYQHSNTLVKNLMLFGSYEMDLYKMVNLVPKSVLSPSSIYLSLRYKLFKKVVINSSYDALKNVIYYETFKSFIDQYIEKELRQGWRIGVDYEPIQNVTLGATASYRFQANHSDPSQNLDFYLSIYQLPWNAGSVNFNYTTLNTTYLQGKIFGGRFTKSLWKGNYSMEATYRNIAYQYELAESPLNQNIFGLHFNGRLLKKLSLGLNGEKTFEKSRRYTSIYCSLIKRF